MHHVIRAALLFYAAFVSALFAMPALGASVFSNLDNADLSGGGVPTNSNAAQASFASAAGTLATQSFESLATGAVPASFAIGGVTASFSSTATVASRIASGVSDFTTFPVGGSQFLYSESAQGTTYFTVTFNTPVRALGFYATDLSDWAGSGGPIPNLQINLTQVSGGTTFNLLNGFDPTTVVNGNVSFFGVIDAANPITGFSITNPLGVPDRDAIGIDLLQVAAVPEPSQWMMLAAGLACLIAFRRRLLAGPSLAG